LINKQLIKDILSLSKVIVSLSVTYTAIAGYIIANHNVDIKLIFISFGVFILSSGASAFNHIQERKTDALMTRTQNRPIPTGRLSIKFALIFAIVSSIMGCIILFLSTNLIVVALGIFNLLWYNLVYTPLKRITVWAVFVGTLTGAIPFYMGYFSTVNQFPTPIANFIAIFLLIWQIPHFLLLLGIYGKEYEKAGLASITKKTADPNLYRLSVLWLMTCCIISLLLPLFSIINYKTTNYLIITISGIVFLTGFLSLFFSIQHKHKFLFIVSNLMQVAIITGLIIDNLY
jgi:heme o synthase